MSLMKILPKLERTYLSRLPNELLTTVDAIVKKNSIVRDYEICHGTDRLTQAASQAFWKI